MTTHLLHSFVVQGSRGIIIEWPVYVQHLFYDDELAAKFIDVF